MGQLLWILTLAAAAGAAPADRDPPPAVAIVSRLAGTAHRIDPGGDAVRPLELFDRLAPETVVETGPGSEVEIVFRRGDRWVLEARGRARIGRQDLQVTQGETRDLEPVAPLLAVEPLWFPDSTPQRAGAVRIRRRDAAGVSPADGDFVLPDAVELRFPPLGRGRRYLLTVETAVGEVVLETEIRARSFEVPAGLLAGGERYTWHVTAEMDARRIHRGGLFRTVDRAAAAARQELAAHVQSEDDAGLRQLLCEIDRSLALATPACPTPGAAADGTPESGITLARSPEAGW